MSDTQDRLALIARAGKRLLASKEYETPRYTDTPAPAQRSDASREMAQDSAALRANKKPDSPLPNLKQMEPPAAGDPVKLAFSQLRREGILTPDNMRSNLGFEYRTIKRKLLANVRAAQDKRRRNNLLMVTSPRPAEGKTFTAISLAIALATERDVGVLLVDADVLRPKLTTMFEPSNGMGLVDVLSGRCSNPMAVIRCCSDLPNLHVIFSGTHDEKAPELIAGRRIADICDAMSERFSTGIVILDTAPVLALPETMNLAASMHHIVMVVASGQTTRSELQAALENVAACPNINLILNKAPAWNTIAGDAHYYLPSPQGVGASDGDDSSMRR